MRQHEPRWQNALKLSSDSSPFSSPVYERGVLVPASFLGPFLCSALGCSRALCAVCSTKDKDLQWLMSLLAVRPHLHRATFMCCSCRFVRFTLVLNMGCASNPFRFETDPHIENISISPAASRDCWSSVQALLF